MIRFSIEKLWHFKCPKCGGWFTIGDYQGKSGLYCPHCGYFSELLEWIPPHDNGK